MRPYSRSLALCLGLIALITVSSRVSADDAKLDGKWKLVVLAFGEDEFLIFEATESGGQIIGAQQFLGNTTVKSIEQKGDRITAVFNSAGQDSPFIGTRAKDGDEPRPYLGSFRFRSAFYPARLERTEAGEVAALNRGTLPQQIATAARERDVKARVEKLEQLIGENTGKPFINSAYTMLLNAAADAGLGPDQVEKHVSAMMDNAKPYGSEWFGQVRINALRAIAGKPAFAELTLKLAADADKALGPDASTEEQANITRLYADAAKHAGKLDLAESLEAKSAKLEAKLDAEYLENVPPFKPVAYSGRKNAGDDRVVVLELFTGAQCPPCVAADVGFDALLKTYQPSELVALQYHLHIPGPDPLTNPAALARAKYYGVRSTPSTFFNGELSAQGGGGMAQSQGKYDQYRNIIDERLYGNKIASIDLNVKRTGNSIQIAATAKADPAELTKKPAAETDKPKAPADKNGPDNPKDDAETKKQDEEPKLKLYLVVTEENVRYVGSNRIRFHHHLVRAFAGGTDGIALADGSAKANVTITLDDIQKELNGYLSEYQKTGSFPNPLPPIELDGLSIAAFVQDDTSKKILHATSVAVPGK